MPGFFADVVLIIHVAFALFIVGGLGLILVGGIRGWRWIRNPWFRTLHLAGILLVVIQAWLGIVCPLTTLEMQLRESGGQPSYGGTFMAHWLHQLLFFEAPAWVFTVCYTGFGSLVVLSFAVFRPRSFARSKRDEA